MASLKFPLNGEWVKLKVYAIVDALHTRLESTKFPGKVNVQEALEELADTKSDFDGKYTSLTDRPYLNDDNDRFVLENPALPPRMISELNLGDIVKIPMGTAEPYTLIDAIIVKKNTDSLTVMFDNVIGSGNNSTSRFYFDTAFERYITGLLNNFTSDISYNFLEKNYTNSDGRTESRVFIAPSTDELTEFLPALKIAKDTEDDSAARVANGAYFTRSGYLKYPQYYSMAFYVDTNGVVREDGTSGTTTGKYARPIVEIRNEAEIDADNILQGATIPIYSGDVHTIQKGTDLYHIKDAVARDGLEGKVDKVTGKGLSTNDFTTAEKEKLSELENYDDSEIKQDIENLETSKYEKPSTGIPKTDLASDVQSSLNSADTALQEVPSTYRTAAAQDIIDNGKSDKPLTAQTVVSPLAVRTIYDLGVQTSLTLNLPATGQLGDWLEIDFLSGTTATNLTVTSSAGMTDFELSPAANSIYAIYANWQRIDVVNDTAVYGWALSYAENKRTVSE